MTTTACSLAHHINLNKDGCGKKDWVIGWSTLWDLQPEKLSKKPLPECKDAYCEKPELQATWQALQHAGFCQTNPMVLCLFEQIEHAQHPKVNFSDNSLSVSVTGLHRKDCSSS